MYKCLVFVCLRSSIYIHTFDYIKLYGSNITLFEKKQYVYIISKNQSFKLIINLILKFEFHAINNLS